MVYYVLLFITEGVSISDLYLVNVNLVSLETLWKEIGLALNLSPQTVERIKRNYPQQIEYCFTEMLAAWLSGADRHQDSPIPNWGEVIAALETPSVNRRYHAHQLLQSLTCE